MKKLVLTLTVTLATVAAFAQGKVSFQTDTLHLAYFDPSVGGTLGGTAASTLNNPTTLMADLYMGTSSTSLSLYASTTFSATPGKWSTVSVKADGTTLYNTPVAPAAIPGGTTAFVVTQIRNSAGQAAATLNPTTLTDNASILAYGAGQGDSYIGFSQEFTFTLGTSAIAYPNMYTTASWAQGTFDLSGSAGANTKGAIAILAVPEPASFALAGLGAAALMIFRRRKS